MHWNSNGGKSGLIKMLMKEHGVSKRKAEKAVNAVFDCMARALKRGECVDLPIGKIVVGGATPKQRRRKIQPFRNIQSGEKFYKVTGYPKRVIRFLPARLTPAQKRELIRELCGLLLGDNRELTLAEWRALRRAANNKGLDRLLAYLFQLYEQKSRFANFDALRNEVHQLYLLDWLRQPAPGRPAATRPETPPPGPDEIKKSEQVERLCQQLMGRGRKLTQPEWRELLTAGENLDWLLARLRQLVRDGYSFKDNFYSLRDTVRQLYHVRG